MNCLWNKIVEERGQSSVLVALTAVVLVALLAFIANIGQVIHDKMLTQAVADAVVLSAANVQTVGMNEIADLNAEIKKLKNDLDKDLKIGSLIGFQPGEGLRTFRYYYTQIEYAQRLQKEANREFAKMARKAGQKVLAKHNDNYDKLHPKVRAAKKRGQSKICWLKAAGLKSEKRT